MFIRYSASDTTLIRNHIPNGNLLSSTVGSIQNELHDIEN